MLLILMVLLVTTRTSFGYSHKKNNGDEHVVMGMDIDRLSLLADWIDEQVLDSKLAGASFIIHRNNQLIYESYHGYKNISDKTSINSAISRDTIFRILSMSKSVTSVALMMLYEENKFKLTDYLYEYIPAFKKENMNGIYDYVANANLTVGELRYITDIKTEIKTIPIKKDIQIWQLLTHTAGLSYCFDFSGKTQPVDILYRELNDKLYGGEITSSEFVNELAKLPLIYEPGTEWDYSFATDVMGRLIEVISGQSLDEYLYEHMFEPLGMYNTGFRFNEVDVGDTNRNNLAVLYRLDSEGILHEDSMLDILYEDDFPFFSGGVGLLSTLHDYSKFTQMLVNGGKLPNVNGKKSKRLLSSKTVDFIRMNHLPGNNDIASIIHSHSVFPDKTKGVGFGLGFANILNLRTSDGVSDIGSIDKYWWSGGTDAWFYIDPTEKLSIVFMTQLMSIDDGIAEDHHGVAPDFGDALNRFIYSAFAE